MPGCGNTAECPDNGKRKPTPGMLGDYAADALTEELELSPKPGLVTPLDCGAHADMDAGTFRSGIAALRPYFSACARQGAAWALRDPVLPGPDHFAALRELGREGEAAMFEATGGVNTHKGAVFSLGLLCAAAGHALARAEADPVSGALVRVKELCRGLTARDFAAVISRGRGATAGERLFLRYGVTGIRGQAEAGFPVVANAGLPLLRAGLSSGQSRDTAALGVLLAFMREVEDTNVLHRAGPEGLAFVRRSASNALQLGGAGSGEGLSAVRRMGEAFRRRRISPGGCADLLGLTLFLDRLGRQPH